MATGDRPTTAPGWELFPQMHALIDAADPRFTLVATVQEAADVMTWLEALTTSSLWNMQRHSTVEALRDEAGLAARARAKGVEMCASSSPDAWRSTAAPSRRATSPTSGSPPSRTP